MPFQFRDKKINCCNRFLRRPLLLKNATSSHIYPKKICRSVQPRRPILYRYNTLLCCGSRRQIARFSRFVSLRNRRFLFLLFLLPRGKTTRPAAVRSLLLFLIFLILRDSAEWEKGYKEGRFPCAIREPHTSQYSIVLVRHNCYCYTIANLTRFTSKI